MEKTRFMVVTSICLLYFSTQLPIGECCAARWFGSLEPEQTTSSPHETASVNNNETEVNEELLAKVVSSAILNLFESVINNQTKMNFSCPEPNGNFPDEIDCHSYYICENSNFTVHKCNDSLGFDKLTKQCVQKDTIELCRLLERNPDFVCSKNGLFKHPVDCHKFVVCVKEVGYTSSCSDSQYFDSENSMCVPNKDHLGCPDLIM